MAFASLIVFLSGQPDPAAPGMAGPEGGPAWLGWGLLVAVGGIVWFGSMLKGSHHKKDD